MASVHNHALPSSCICEYCVVNKRFRRERQTSAIHGNDRVLQSGLPPRAQNNSQHTQADSRSKSDEQPGKILSSEERWQDMTYELDGTTLSEAEYTMAPESWESESSLTEGIYEQSIFSQASDSTVTPQSLVLIGQLETQLVRQRDTEKALRDEIKDKDKTIENLENKISDLEEEQQRRAGSSDSISLAGRCEELEKMCNKLRKNKKDLQQELRGAREQIDVLEGQLDSLRTRLRQSQKDGDEHAQELKGQHKREMDQTRAKLERTTAALVSTRRERDLAAQRAEALELQSRENFRARAVMENALRDRIAREEASPPLPDPSTAPRETGSLGRSSRTSRRRPLPAGSYKDMFGRGEVRRTIVRY